MKTGNLAFTLLTCLGLLLSSSLAAEKPAADGGFKDDPSARALYDAMTESMRKADTLSWVSDYRWEAQGREIGHARYQIWLKKPNYARVEAQRAHGTNTTGILVGDGDNFWIYWPDKKPCYSFEMKGKYAEEYEKYQRKFYMKQRTPQGKHSIGHETSKLGAGMSMTILDPSTFHGYTDSLQSYIDGVRSMESEKIGDDLCDVIEVSIMKHQRSWYLWLSKKDHLPRKLKQIVRVSYDIITEESWSDVTVNSDIPNDRFAWKPPGDWKEFRMPDIEEGLLKAGTIAPDFELASLDGGKIKLSNFSGKVVWLNKWRCG